MQMAFRSVVDTTVRALVVLLTCSAVAAQNRTALERRAHEIAGMLVEEPTPEFNCRRSVPAQVIPYWLLPEDRGDFGESGHPECEERQF